MTELEKRIEEVREKLKTYEWDKSTWIVIKSHVREWKALAPTAPT